MVDRRGRELGTTSRGASEWVGGRLTAPMYITGEGEPYRPDFILWLELPEGYIVGTEILHPREPVARFAEVLRRAMRQPMVGPPRRPARVRVAEQALAEAVRADLGEGMPVEVAPTPELDMVLHDMSLGLGSAGDYEPESYLEEGRVPPAALADLFRAAQALFVLAPWKQADDSQVLRVDIPRLDVSGACLSIIGALGESIGLLLFPSFAGFEAFAVAAEQMSPEGPIDLGGSYLALTFERGAEIPASMRREVAEHGWPVAGPDAYPHVVMRDRDGLPRPLTERDVRVMAACARSLSALCVKHGDRWSDDAFEPICESYADGDGLEVRFTVPYHAGRLFAVNDASPGGRPRVGRNAPCPCGSGKKYKKCHLAADTAAAPPEEEEISDARLVGRIMDWAARRFGVAWAGVLAEAEADPNAAQIVVPWCAYHAQVSDRRIAEHFGESSSAKLTSAEREWLDAQLQSWLSIWEVTRIEPDAGVHVTDLLTGESRYVDERTASRTLVARHTVLARVVDHAGRSTFCGLAPRALAPLQADDVVQRVRARLRVRGPVKPARLRGDAIGRYLLARWREAVDTATARAAAPPRLSNTDGDALLFTIDHFALETTAREQLERRLLDLGAVPVDAPDAGERRYDVVRPHPDDPDQSTIIGHLRLADTALAAETNSIARADALRRRLEAVCGWLLRHRLREHSDPRALLARGTGAAAKAPAADLDPVEKTRIERELKERHYRRWLDESIPALDGATPRAAVGTPAGRHRVDVLLRDIEHHESRLPPDARIDLAPLRRELGFDP